MSRNDGGFIWLAVYVSAYHWCFVLTRCCVLTCEAKILMRAILNVIAGHRFSTPDLKNCLMNLCRRWKELFPEMCNMISLSLCSCFIYDSARLASFISFQLFFQHPTSTTAVPQLFWTRHKCEFGEEFATQTSNSVC